MLAKYRFDLEVPRVEEIGPTGQLAPISPAHSNDPGTPPTWNFDITRIAPEDLQVMMFYLEHKRMPAAEEFDPAPVFVEAVEGGPEFTLIELAALFANGVLIDPGPVLRELHWTLRPEGVLPASWSGDRVFDMAERGAGNLLGVFKEHGLEALLPILSTYRFAQ